MLFGKAKIHNKNLLEILAEHKIGCLDITMNEPSIMNFLNSLQHFNQQLNCNFETVMRLKIFPDFCQVVSKQIHDNQILFTILDKIIDIAHMLESFQTDKNIIFKYEYAFILIFLFYLESNIFVENLIKSLVDETECALAEFLLQVESLRDFQGIFELLVYLVLGACRRDRSVLHGSLGWNWCRMVLRHLVVFICSSSLS